MAEVAARTSFVGTKIASGKTEFAARLSVIDPALAAAVKNGSVQVVDAVLYTARKFGGDTTVELMQSSDDKKAGVSNVNNRKLEANTYFLCTGIQLLSATGAGNVETLSFAQTKVPQILNGDFELKCGDKILVPRSSMEIFRNGDNAEREGFFALDCPKLISPLTDIIPQVWLTGAAPENTAIKIVLYGVKTNKA